MHGQETVGGCEICVVTGAYPSVRQAWVLIDGVVHRLDGLVVGSAAELVVGRPCIDA